MEPKHSNESVIASERSERSNLRDCFVGLAGLLAMTLIFCNHSADLFAQATVKGRVVFEGTPPAPETIEVKSDTPTCGTSKEIRKILWSTSV